MNCIKVLQVINAGILMGKEPLRHSGFKNRYGFFYGIFSNNINQIIFKQTNI